MRVASRYRAPSTLAAFLAFGAATPNAGAVWEDRLELFVAQSATHDDNVFRLPAGLDPRPILGRNSTADLYRTTSFGANFDVPVSAQRFVGSVEYDKYRFGQFGELDFDGHSRQAFWLWAVGKRADGRLGYRENLSLASFANLQGGVGDSTPNFLDLDETIFEVNYNAAPHWKVRGALTKLEHANSAVAFRISDASIATVAWSVSRLSTAGNEIGLGVQLDDGDLPNLQFIGISSIDNSYEQRTIAAFIDSAVTERSRLRLRAGPIERRYPRSPQRNFDDWMVDATLEWGPTENFMLATSAGHNISRDEQINVGFVLVDSVAVQPTLRFTPKTSLTLLLWRGKRDYLGDPALAASGVSPVFSERTAISRLSLFYEPTALVRLGLGLRRETRDATRSLADYDARVATLEVRVAF